jgi:long-chain fatty acid transport protein
MLNKLFTVLFLVFFLPSLLFSGGFQLNEHGAKAMAQAGAFAARATDPSAIFFNPAGIAQLKGLNLYLGTTLISPSMKFKGPVPLTTETEMDSKLFTPINVYVTYQVNDMISVGVGVNNPFGLGTQWPDTWVGNQLSVKSEIQIFNFNPTVAVKLLDGMLNIGAGFDYSIGTVEITRKLLNPLTNKPDIDFSLKNKMMDGKGSGFNFGVLLKALDNLSIGLSYRSKVKFDISGTATVNPNPVHPLLKQAIFSDGLTATSTINLPATSYIAVAYSPMKEFTVEADAQFVGWSSYDKLTIQFNKPLVNPAIDPTKKTITSTANKNYKDVWILRLGGEYKLSNDVCLRGGYFHDFSPAPDETLDPMLPDADRNGFNIGAGIKINDMISIDIAYLFLPFNERTITTQENNFNGTYNTTTHLFGIDIGFSF